MKTINITLLEYLVRYAVKHFSGKARCGVAPNRYVRDALKKNMAQTGTTGKIMIRTCESKPTSSGIYFHRIIAFCLYTSWTRRFYVDYYRIQ